MKDLHLEISVVGQVRQLTGDKGSYLVIALHELSVLFCNFTNTTLGQIRAFISFY